MDSAAGAFWERALRADGNHWIRATREMGGTMSEVEPAKTDPFRFRLGSYGVLSALGSGGMSSVYRAVHLELGREVALKVLPPHMAKNPTVLRRFVGEAKHAGALEHPNIVSIYDRGSDDGRYYLVLEYVGGGDLHDYVQRKGPMAPADAADVIRQVALGLEHAASRGLIHRDIKPSNLLRTPEGVIKIADLGLALRAEDEDERVTRVGTTVGTVDYMSPEQARDSRATSHLSDIYSLGCTFYYLLTGSAPFPGGGIAERLARHAQESVPDVRAKRPEIPAAVAVIVSRMMAKRPEDRYATYRDLLSALNAAAPSQAAHDTTIALAPIDDDFPPALPAPRPSGSGSGSGSVQTPRRPQSSLPEISLASLAPALLEEAKPQSRREVAAVAPRRASISIGPRGSTLSDRAWLIRCVVLGFLTIVVVIGLDLILRPYPNIPSIEASDAAAPVPRRPWTELDETETESALEPPPGEPPAAVVEAPPPAPETKPAPTPPPAWVEPQDPPLVVGPPKSYPEEILAEYLPDWGRVAVPLEIDGPTTVVRRVAENREAGSAASLRLAFNVPKGNIEVDDAGPHFIDDARVAGETRLIRAGEGVRPVIRIEGSSSDAVRALPGIFALDGRTLILDSVDLVVNVRDLGMNQRALFHCAGSRLTLKNCTVTIVNPLRLPFVFLRADDANGRESRVRIEDSLIRGDVAPLIELGRGSTELMVARSVLFGDGAILRLADADSTTRHRLHALGSALGSRGPCLDLGSGKPGSTPRLAVKVHDTAFGRFAGPGVSSLATSADPDSDLSQALQWRGSANLYSGWGSYYASGPDAMIRVGNLQAFRSTWNNERGDAREIAAEWPAPPAIADASPRLLGPLAPGFEWLIARVARPRPYLLARTLLGFPVPEVPEVVAWRSAGGPASKSASAGDEVVELVFDADSDEWDGDLGNFLRDVATPDRRRLRVRVVGSGPRRSSPVKLPDGLVLEMRVEPPAAADAPWLSFSPSRGGPLLELRGGALVLSGFRFQVAAGAAPESSLARVDDGHLILQRCEILEPREASEAASVSPLVDFRAASTKPLAAPPGPPLFAGAVDRPVCLIADSVLATGGSAIRAEVGAGLLAFNNSLIAARGDAIDLNPAKVARSRFAADLRIDRCTVVSSSSIIRLSAWPGDEPGPDRPWLITSSNTAYLDFPDRDRPPRESVLFRAEESSFDRGEVFWRQTNDAIEVFGFAAAGAGQPSFKTRDIGPQWVALWGTANIRGIAGPRPNASSPSVRFRGTTRPDRIEPGMLILDPSYHPGRPKLDLGAEPSRLGVAPRK